MVRVGSLYDQMLVSKDIRDNKTNMTCQEQLFAIFDQVKLLTQRKDAAYAELKTGLETRAWKSAVMQNWKNRMWNFWMPILNMRYVRYSHRRSWERNSRSHFQK